MPLLSERDCQTIFYSRLSPLIEVRNAAGAVVIDGVQQLTNRLALLCGGHARSIEYLLTAIESLELNDVASLYDVIREAVNLSSWGNYHVSWPVVRSVLNGESVQIHEDVPDLYIDSIKSILVTYDQLISSGQLLQSVGVNGNIVPFVPEMYLQYWTRSSQDASAAHLRAIFVLRQSFTPFIFENMMQHWVQLMRYVRFPQQRIFVEGGDEDGVIIINNQCLSMNQLFRDGIRGSNISSMTTAINACHPLALYEFQNITELNEKVDCLGVPKSRSNPYFDFVEKCLNVNMIDGRDKVLHLFYQTKYSDTDSTTKLSNSEIIKCYNGCMSLLSHIDRESAVVVIIAWREIWGNVDMSILPPNCVVYDRDMTCTLLGNPMSNFLSMQDTSPLLISKKFN